MKLSELLELLRSFGFKAVGKKVKLEEALSMPRPIVLKADTLEHKTEKKLVFVGLKSEEEIEEAYTSIREAGFDVIAQPFVEGFEFIMGAKLDKTFGKVLMLGSGGVLAELLEDVSFRVVPISKEDAAEMTREIKASKFFEGFRGRKASREAVIDALLKLNELSLKIDFKELDINPLIVNEQGAFVVDARLFR